MKYILVNYYDDVVKLSLLEDGSKHTFSWEEVYIMLLDNVYIVGLALAKDKLSIVDCTNRTIKSMGYLFRS